MDEHEQAWSDYYDAFIKQKNEILTKLQTIKRDVHTKPVFKVWLEQTIDFIKEYKG